MSTLLKSSNKHQIISYCYRVIPFLTYMDRRGLNFSNEEIGFLLSLVDEFKDVVECKRSDTVLWRDKEAAWVNIAKKLVQLGFPHRTTKQLRDKWGNLKKETKKKYGDDKIESFKTGGGQKKVIRFTPMDDKIKSIIGVAITGDSNIFDSDKSERDCTDSRVNRPDTQEFDVNPQDIADYQEDEQNMAGVGELKEGDSSWASWNPATLRTSKAIELSKKQEPENRGEQLPLVPTWTPKRLLFKDKTILNDDNKIKGKFIAIKNLSINPKLLVARLQTNKEISKSEPVTKPEMVTKPETVTKPAAVANPKIPNKFPLEDVATSSRRNISMKKKTALTADCRIKLNVLSEAKLELVAFQKECLKKEIGIKEKEHALRMEHEKEEHEIKMKKHKIELELLQLELKKKPSLVMEIQHVSLK